MKLYTTRKNRFLHLIKVSVPLLFLAACLFLFVFAIRQTGEDTLQKQKQSLEQSIVRSAIRTYALTGRYPESLSEILRTYGITYDTSHFVVEYLPSGANLFPQIYVISLGGSQ